MRKLGMKWFIERFDHVASSGHQTKEKEDGRKGHEASARGLELGKNVQDLKCSAHLLEKVLALAPSFSLAPAEPQAGQSRCHNPKRMAFSFGQASTELRKRKRLE